MELIFSKSRSGRRGSSLPALDVPGNLEVPEALRRKNPAGLPEVSELDAIRHFTLLSRQNMGVDTHFYPLGSCTMKYNPKFHERVVGLPGFADLHPLLPQLRQGGGLSQGALAVLHDAERILSELLGFDQFTMQPMAGAHGELTGVMLMAALFKDSGDAGREVMLIPDSAHGTNPASAAMAGFKSKELPTDENGNVDMKVFKETLGPDVAGIMLTSPNTLGLYDPNTEEICRLVHECGGLNYCDGANLNALLGRVRPGDLGFDLIHVNLHKTFATPHGGGGPGSGPVGVCERLTPYLPISRVVKRDDGAYSLEYDHPKSIGYIAPFYGNFGVILKAYAYMLTLGREGFLRVSENAVLNANYARARLAPRYDQKYDRHCMHECVLSAERQTAKGIHALDIAKALLDRGFHAPTMYFPLIVSEALMIEPTETESKETIDAFVEAMIEIADLAETSPETVTACPTTTPVRRLDETLAAREPDLACLKES